MSIYATLWALTIADRMVERFKLKELFGTTTMMATRNALQGVT